MCEHLLCWSLWELCCRAASLVFTNYTIQLGFIPRVIQRRPDYVTALTMANPASFAWFLEMFGYAAMGVATWLVAPGFRGTRRADAIRYLLIGNDIVSIVGVACTASFDRWVFSTFGLVSFAAWNILIAVCFLLIAITRDGGFTGGLKRRDVISPGQSSTFQDSHTT